MSASTRALGLPCPKCHVGSGKPCVRRDGEPAARSHCNRTPPAPCGSYGGYQRHKRAGEEPCEECRAANSRYTAERRRVNPEEREQALAGLRATNRATRRLVNLHRDEWHALVAEEKAGLR